MRMAAVLVVTAAVTACQDRGTHEQLTVVVEADRARALADQQRLAEMQASLSAAAQELADTRTDLTVLRQKLLRAGTLDAVEIKRLEEREGRLRAREGGLGGVGVASQPVSAAGLTRADVESLLRAQEERLRGVIANAPSPPAPQAGEVADVATLLATVAEVRARRGLREDDVDGGPALARRVDEALLSKRHEVALDAAKLLLKKTEGTIVNATFVKKKYARATGRLEVLSGDAREKAKKLLGDANARNARGDAAGANEALNAALELP